jgi:DNA-binding phage protein
MIETQKLNAAFKAGDREKICAAIRATILAAVNVSALAREAGVDRTMLYRTFKHNPGFGLVLKVLSAADFKLVVVDHPKLCTKPSVIAERLTCSFATEEITLIVKAFGETLRAQDNVFMFAKKANLNRVVLYKAFSADRVPKLGTVLGFLNALKLRLAVNRMSRGSISTE